MARSVLSFGRGTLSRRAESATPNRLIRRLSSETAETRWSSRTSSTSGSLRLSGARVSVPGTGMPTAGALSTTRRMGNSTESPATAVPLRVINPNWYAPERTGVKLPENRLPITSNDSAVTPFLQIARASGAVTSPFVSSLVPAGKISVSPPVGTVSLSSPRYAGYFAVTSTDPRNTGSRTRIAMVSEPRLPLVNRANRSLLSGGVNTVARPSESNRTPTGFQVSPGERSQSVAALRPMASRLSRTGSPRSTMDRSARSRTGATVASQALPGYQSAAAAPLTGPAEVNARIPIAKQAELPSRSV